MVRKTELISVRAPTPTPTEGVGEEYSEVIRAHRTAPRHDVAHRRGVSISFLYYCYYYSVISSVIETIKNVVTLRDTVTPPYVFSEIPW